MYAISQPSGSGASADECSDVGEEAEAAGWRSGELPTVAAAAGAPAAGCWASVAIVPVVRLRCSRTFLLFFLVGVAGTASGGSSVCEPSAASMTMRGNGSCSRVCLDDMVVRRAGRADAGRGDSDGGDR